MTVPHYPTLWYTHTSLLLVEYAFDAVLYPLLLPSRRGGMIGVDWIVGLPTTVAGFDITQNHVDLLSGKVHAVPTRSTAIMMAADAAAIIRDKP